MHEVNLKTSSLFWWNINGREILNTHPNVNKTINFVVPSLFFLKKKLVSFETNFCEYDFQTITKTWSNYCLSFANTYSYISSSNTSFVCKHLFIINQSKMILKITQLFGIVYSVIDIPIKIAEKKTFWKIMEIWDQVRISQIDQVKILHPSVEFKWILISAACKMLYSDWLELRTKLTSSPLNGFWGGGEWGLRMLTWINFCFRVGFTHIFILHSIRRDEMKDFFLFSNVYRWP